MYYMQVILILFVSKTWCIDIEDPDDIYIGQGDLIYVTRLQEPLIITSYSQNYVAVYLRDDSFFYKRVSPFYDAMIKSILRCRSDVVSLVKGCTYSKRDGVLLTTDRPVFYYIFLDKFTFNDTIIDSPLFTYTIMY